MKYVGSKLLTVLAFSSLLLTGCEDPGVNISTLGLKLAAPQLKGTNPFDQDFDSQNYAHIQGTCDTRVGDISISLNDNNWQTPPVTPDTTGTSLGSVTNDINCADGVFDVYLTKADLTSLWGITVAADGGTDVDSILIKGETIIGETKTLTLLDPKQSGSPGSGSGTASKLVIEKVWPTNFAGLGQCEMFRIYLTDSQGNETSSTSAVPFTFTSDLGTGVSSVVSAYTSWDDCNSGLNSATSFSIPAKTSGINIYYKFPAGSTEQVQNFSATGSTLQITKATVQTRDPNQGRRWISLTDAPATMYKNVCYQVSMRRLTYTKASAADSESVDVSLISSTAKLRFYAGSDCASGEEITSATFGSGVSDSSFYAKYTPATGDAATISTAIVSYSTSSTKYDANPFRVRIDTTNNSTIARVDFWGADTVTRGTCSAYTVVTANSNWTPIAGSTDTIVNLATTISESNFYTDAYCTSTTSTATISAGQMSTKIYYKAVPAAETSGTLAISATGLIGNSRNIAVNIKPIIGLMSLYSGTSITKGTCTKVQIELRDSVGPIQSTQPMTFNFSSSNSGTANIHYYDSATNCAGNAAMTSALTLTPVSSLYYFYIKVDAAFTESTVFTVVNSSTSGYNLGFNNGFTVAP